MIWVSLFLALSFISFFSDFPEAEVASNLSLSSLSQKNWKFLNKVLAMPREACLLTKCYMNEEFTLYHYFQNVITPLWSIYFYLLFSVHHFCVICLIYFVFIVICENIGLLKSCPNHKHNIIFMLPVYDSPVMTPSTCRLLSFFNFLLYLRFIIYLYWKLKLTFLSITKYNHFLNVPCFVPPHPLAF